MKAIIHDVMQLDELTPELLAEAFWDMDSSEQARFYNHLATISNINFIFQCQYITDDHDITPGGRRVMSRIGEYAYWGTKK